MADLFDATPDPAPADHRRLRAAGFTPYSGTGAPNGFWMRNKDGKVLTEAEAIEVLEREGRKDG